MPSIPSVSEPDPIELVRWACQLTEREARQLRQAHASEFARAVDAARASWEREGKPRLPIVDPRSLA